MFFSYKEMDAAIQMYKTAELAVRKADALKPDQEAKASILSNTSKGKLFRSLNRFHKFGVVIKQNSLNKNIFNNKKSKQRYLDYAFKISVKRKFQRLMTDKVINQLESINLHFHADEHTTATDGRYELKEALEQEFKYGTFNYNYQKFFPPIFNNLNKVYLDYCDSKSKPLIRAADIVANRFYFLATHGELNYIRAKDKTLFISLPY